MPPSSPAPLIAHRGWTRRHPENTLAAVRGALEAGARWVEIDVQLSSDRVPHLFHDGTLDRMTGARGPIHLRSAAELAELHASEPARFGARFADEPVARLDDFVELLLGFKESEAFVELKQASLQAFGAQAVLDAVLPVLAPAAQRCRLISFDLEVLREARSRCRLELGPVLETWRQRSAPEVLALEPEVVFCDVERLPVDGSIAPPRGQLAVYEVDDPARARALLARGATWIETFAVGEMLQTLSEVEGRPT